MKRKKEKGKAKRTNREYTNVLWIITGVFVLMVGYLVWFQIVDSRDVINNPYNARLDTFEEKVVRGNILASDGQILAYTRVESDGTENRIYPFDCTFSHVLGYADYGKTGIESLGNFQLLTSNAYFIERFLNELQGEKNIGDSLVTTLDVDLQTAAHDALSTREGAVIVIEPSTGNVRALVSKPDYDPGTVAENWEELSTSEDSILLNRAMQGLYPPGSIFKTVTLLEYLREHNMFAKSCNSAFADMGRDLDVEELQNLASQLLFNSDLPLSFPYSRSSFSLKENDTEAIKMMTAIGQGDTLVTPMHMAMLASAVANDGVLMVPRFLDRTENYTGQLVERYSTETYGALMTQEEAQVLQEYMRAVVEDGTASALQSDSYTASGKTGTAEYSSDKSKSHAWFIGYVTGSKPDLAVCVLVEEAGSGSEYAVPIAKRIFDAYYAE